MLFIKKRPLNAEDKFELYEQKHLSKDTKESVYLNRMKNVKYIQQSLLLFSMNELIDLQRKIKI